MYMDALTAAMLSREDTKDHKPLVSLDTKQDRQLVTKIA